MKNILGVRSPHLIASGKRVKLERMSTDSTAGVRKQNAAKLLQTNREAMVDLQERLYASGKRSLLIVLQGMDAAGKDGTISHIFSGVNPQGCSVQSFKVPNSLEARHDFLWRIHAAVPARGMITVFNRSQYEDVLSPRVHGLISDEEAKLRFAAINDFERNLSQSGTAILKVFLHISHEEQGRRLQERIDDPAKHWKLNTGDFIERKLWPKYQQAYADILSETNTPYAPWIVVPADHKWYRNVVVSEVIVQAMRAMKLEYPKSDIDISTLHI